MLLAIWSLGAAVMLPKSSPAARRLWLLAATWLLGLTLTSSKWEWHFAVYTTPAVLLSALTGAGLFRGVRLRAITAALLMTLLLVAVGVRGLLRGGGAAVVLVRGAHDLPPARTGVRSVGTEVGLLLLGIYP